MHDVSFPRFYSSRIVFDIPLQIQEFRGQPPWEETLLFSKFNRNSIEIQSKVIIDIIESLKKGFKKGFKKVKNCQ